jgi:DNA-binding transcriptional LysR family regulator
MGERTIDLIDEDSILRSGWRCRPIPVSSSAALPPGGTCCAVRLPILKNTDHRSNCPNSQNAIGFAIYSIRMGDDWHFVDRKGAPASVRVSGNLVTNSGETVRTAALQGVGISLAAGFLVAEDLEQGRLVRLLPQYRSVEFSMNAVSPHRRHLSAKVRSFIDLLMHHSVEHQRPIDPFS